MKNVNSISWLANSKESARSFTWQHIHLLGNNCELSLRPCTHTTIKIWRDQKWAALFSYYHWLFINFQSNKSFIHSPPRILKRCDTRSCMAEGSLHCWARFCMAWTASSISWGLLAFSWPETHTHTHTIQVIKLTYVSNQSLSDQFPCCSRVSPQEACKTKSNKHPFRAYLR